ncbi:hypothetical protein [Sphingomonas sp. UYP23]
MQQYLPIVLNALMALGSLIGATIALMNPAALITSPSISAGEIFYSRMFAARAIPFALITAFVPLHFGGPVSVVIIFTAAAIQAADAAIGVQNRNRTMAVGGSIAAIVHGLCGLAVMSDT